MWLWGGGAGNGLILSGGRRNRLQYRDQVRMAVTNVLSLLQQCGNYTDHIV
jgi:hypothetical protein